MEDATAKLLVGPVCAGVGLALQVVHSSTDGFFAGVAVVVVVVVEAWRLELTRRSP